MIKNFLATFVKESSSLLTDKIFIMKLKRLLLLSCILTALLSVVLLGACTSEKKFKVGISQCSSDDWRNKMNEEIMREVMLHDNVEVEIRSADDNSAKQIDDLDYFVNNGFDLIAVAPNEANALTPKIKQIYESGIPVIVYDRDINGPYFTAFQGADNYEIGRMAAAYVANLTSDSPKIIEITGLPGSTPTEGRSNGFRNMADSLGYSIIARASGNWNETGASHVADSMITRFPEVNVIYAHNDRMALGAREVADSLGRGDIKIIGIDAAPRIGVQAVSDGKIDATFLYPTQGHLLMKTALAILQGEQFEKMRILPSPAHVDRSNAQFILLQDNALREETNKIGQLQARVATFSQRYATQKNMLYAAAAIILLFAVLIFVLLRFYWNSKRHHRQMAKRNDELARQRDELDSLYHQLQEATGSKLTFFTNVSHDLRTPLTLISAPVSQLSEADNLTPEQHNMLQLADKNVKRLQRLINQILDIQKYDSGHLKLNLVNINLSESLREWVAPFANLAAHRHIKFHTDIPQKPEIVTAIDVEKCERILFNLLSNAFKFTPENGSISISLSADDKNAIITVTDTGMGIPADELANIFNRFFKTDRINPNGSGIGLALSKVFIDMHGGSIEVSSNEGSGSSFFVHLPLRRVDADAPAANIHSQADISEIEPIDDEQFKMPDDAKTILIIDDNKDICTLVRNILGDSYTILSANSGAQGIRLAHKFVPDLIICDVMMPGMDGYQVCKSLKSDSLTSHIPVLLLTACSRDEQRVEGYDCGADAFMTKPFDPSMLVSRCNSLIANRDRIYTNLDAKSIPLTPGINYARKPSATLAQAHAYDDEFVQRFAGIIDSRLADPELSVEVIADEMGISRVQLYRKIKALTNCTAVELIRNIRLKKAAIMLKTTTATISEIAYAVGFSSPGYFSKCYKEYHNETPGDTQKRTSKPN